MSDYWSTAEVAAFLKVTDKTIIRWAGSGKQKKDGFPKPKYTTKQHQFDPEEIIAWRSGKRFY
ncbi:MULTISPECIES: DNA-binding protein [Morganella]|uniref:DNA-binding protein n=1 Tax=Morganella TaxID=581 RepID=UPI000425C27B|nr:MULTISPECIES: DNA-binding protein [Morganella]ETO41439.1 hypothetical protein X965_07865 [Morganella sp. EGD-HP17]KGP45180.1 hypothetical protein LR61_03910 [Morganella morganii]MDU2633261.1 DNA-binding protein [Morganella morganii]NIH18955.1 DNA-binding protein [Morganella morganii]STZ19205.1 Uncharacterised protein [Morganella morganii]